MDTLKLGLRLFTYLFATLAILSIPYMWFIASQFILGVMSLVVFSILALLTHGASQRLEA